MMKRDPKALLAATSSLEEHCALLVSLLHRQNQRLDAISLSVALARLLKLYLPSKVPPPSFPGLFAELVRQCRSGLSRFKARAIANVFHNLVECGLCENQDSEFCELASALLADLLTRIPAAEYDGPLSVVSIVHSLANCKSRVAKVSDDRLPVQLLQELDVTLLKPKDVAILCWSLAKLNRIDYGDFVERVVDLRCAELVYARDLVNVMWALACLNKPRLLPILGDHCLDKTTQFTPQDISNSLWAFATTNTVHLAFFAAMERELVRRDLASFTSQGLSIVCWSLAQVAPMSVGNIRVFEHLSKALCARELARFSPQSLSNILIAYAKVDVFDGRVVDSVAEECLLRGLREFGHQHVANMIWALGALQVVHEGFVNMLLMEWSHRPLHEASTCSLATSAWGLAVLGVDCGGALNVIATEASRRCNEFKVPELAMLVWACACAQAFDQPGVRALLAQPAPIVEFTEHAVVKQYRDVINAWHLDQNGAELPSLLQIDLPVVHDKLISRPSQTHLAVASALRSLGCRAVEIEVLLNIGLVVDIVVVSPRGVDVAIEIDGLYHYLRDRKTPNGSTMFKQRLLREAQIKFIVVRVEEWHRLPVAAQQAMLQSRLLQAER